MKHLTDTTATTPFLPNAMKHIRLWCSTFAPKRQQDTEEAFQYLFATYDAVDVRQLRMQLRIASSQVMPQHVLEATSYYDITGASLTSTVRRTTFAHAVHCPEPFTSLQLDMNSTLSSLDEHIQIHFQNEECLSYYNCRNGRCNCIGTCNMQLEFLQWPRVLLVH